MGTEKMIKLCRTWVVGINVGVIATEHVPFGDVKQSGLGREGSSHGMEEYIELKYLCIGDIQK